MSKERASTRTKAGTFAKGISGNPAGRKPTAQLAVTNPRFDTGQLVGSPDDLRRRAQLYSGRGPRRMDDWRNVITGQGVAGRDKRLAGHFQLITLSFDQLKDLWLQDDLAAVAVETLPKSARRPGYDLTVSDVDDEAGVDAGDAADLSAMIRDELERLGADEALETVGKYERAYGGGALFVGANDGQTDLTQPLDLKKVKSLDWLTPLEARECIPRYGYADPCAPKYGQPEIYQLTSRSILPSKSANYAATTMDVHESRLIVFPGIMVSRYQSTFGRAGWGESVLSRLWRVLRDFNTAWASAGTLVASFAQAVIKFKDLMMALNEEDGKDAFSERLHMMELAASTINALVIDSDDDYQRQQTPLSGFPELLDKFAVRLAAACGMPLTLLFGTSPAGMNATGESDIRFFYDRVSEYQQQRLAPGLRRLIQILFRCIGRRKEPTKWAIKFRPLWQESAKEIAAAMQTQSAADVAWITAGVISPEEVAKAHWGKGEYDPHLSIDFAAREADEAAAASPVLSDADKAAMKLQPDPEEDPADDEPDPKAAAADDAADAADDRADAVDDAADAEAERMDFDPDQPRDESGRFGSGALAAKVDPGKALARAEKAHAASETRLARANTRLIRAGARGVRAENQANTAASAIEKHMVKAVTLRAAYTSAAAAHEAARAAAKVKPSAANTKKLEAAGKKVGVAERKLVAHDTRLGARSKAVMTAQSAQAKAEAAYEKAIDAHGKAIDKHQETSARLTFARGERSALNQNDIIRAEPRPDGHLMEAFGNGTLRDVDGKINALTPAAQKAVRGHFDRVVAQHGLAPRIGPQSDRLETRTEDQMGGAAGWHYGDGKIVMSDIGVRILAYHAADDVETPGHMQNVGKNIASGAHNVGFVEYLVMTHETVHDHGPSIIGYSQAVAVHRTMAEELSTEMSAREITGRAHGIAGHQIRSGGYDRMIGDAINSVQRATGVSREKAFDAVAQSSIKFKQGTGIIQGTPALRKLASGALEHLGQHSEEKVGQVMDDWGGWVANDLAKLTGSMSAS